MKKNKQDEIDRKNRTFQEPVKQKQQIQLFSQRMNIRKLTCLLSRGVLSFPTPCILEEDDVCPPKGQMENFDYYE